MLGARLAGEQHQLLGADTLRIDVDHQLQSGLLELAEPEVGHLDLPLLGGRQDDAGIRKGRDRTHLCLLDLGPCQHTDPLEDVRAELPLFGSKHNRDPLSPVARPTREAG